MWGISPRNVCACVCVVHRRFAGGVPQEANLEGCRVVSQRKWDQPTEAESWEKGSPSEVHSRLWRTACEAGGQADCAAEVALLPAF